MEESDPVCHFLLEFDSIHNFYSISIYKKTVSSKIKDEL